jgi:hypothetical protein
LLLGSKWKNDFDARGGVFSWTRFFCPRMEGHIEEISIAEIHEGLVWVPSAVVFD